MYIKSNMWWKSVMHFLAWFKLYETCIVELCWFLCLSSQAEGLHNCSLGMYIMTASPEHTDVSSIRPAEKKLWAWKILGRDNFSLNDIVAPLYIHQKLKINLFNAFLPFTILLTCVCQGIGPLYHTMINLN